MSHQEQNLYRHATQAAAGIAIAAGALVLLGWVFDVAALKSVFPGLVTMKVNTAVTFIMAGASLWHTSPANQCRVQRIISQLFATAVLLFGLGTLGEYISGHDFGMDQLLMREETKLPGDIPGRMAIVTAINFSLLGSALLLLDSKSKGLVPVVHLLCVMIAVIAGSGLVGYAYSIEALYRIKQAYTAMAVHTAAIFLVIAFGIVNARPDYPFRRIMTSSSAEVVATRHLLFAAILFPFVAGWLVMKGYRAGYFVEATGMSLLAVSTMAGFGVLVLRNTGLLYEADALRRRAEDELRRHEAQLEEVIARRTEELNKANEALEQQARFDFLTGLINRRFFMELAETELTRALRYESALSVLMLDVDHFKQINDTHGHQAGDAVLKNLAGIFGKTLREIDIVGRVGGEEFAIILPQTDREKAFEAAERLRRVVANAIISLENGLPLTCTASIGVATLAQDGNIDRLLHRADQALYAAKRAGRNQVCASPDRTA